MSAVINFALSAALLAVPPQTNPDLAIWRDMLARACPTSHIVEWMPGRNQDDLVDQFVARLPAKTRAEVRRLSDLRGVCGGTNFDDANWCERNADLHALRHQGLLIRFARYACAEEQCSEPAICERPHKR